MLMCDVTAEQTVQVSTMKKKKNLEMEIDLQWEELERQKMAEYDERLGKEYHKKMKNAKNVQD